MAQNKPRFCRSGYWREWSLVLSTNCRVKPGYGPFVEISLSPTNGWQQSDLTEIVEVRVRRHCTPRSDNDFLSPTLPDNIRESYGEIVGETFANWLLDPRTEILGKIDWQRFADLDAQRGSGGIPLRDIIAPQYLAAIPGDHHSTIA